MQKQKLIFSSLILGPQIFVNTSQKLPQSDVHHTSSPCSSSRRMFWLSMRPRWLCQVIRLWIRLTAEYNTFSVLMTSIMFWVQPIQLHNMRQVNIIGWFPTMIKHVYIDQLCQMSTTHCSSDAVDPGSPGSTQIWFTSRFFISSEYSSTTIFFFMFQGFKVGLINVHLYI